VAYARLEGDYIVCAAYSHELPRYLNEMIRNLRCVFYPVVQWIDKLKILLSQEQGQERSLQTLIL
jgi:hypothetical protein